MKKCYWAILGLLLTVTSCGVDVPLIPFVDNETPIKSQELLADTQASSKS